jgi:hypothetical protein
MAAVARQRHIENNIGILFSVLSAPMATHATKAKQQKNGVFCAVRAELL